MERPRGGGQGSVGSVGGQAASTASYLGSPEQDAGLPAFPSVIIFSL